MKVSYEIVQARPEVEWIQIRYFNDAGQEFWKNIPHADWSPEGVRNLVEALGPEIVAFWERTADVDPATVMEPIQTTGEFECEPENFVVVMPDPPTIREQPEFDYFTERLEQRGHAVGDEWIEWDVIPLTEEEQAQILEQADWDARNARNHWLLMSDWIFCSDANVENREAWLEYRQQLRDLPATCADWPKNIVWPEKPND